MAYFKDLTPYTYFHPEEEAPNTVNIGWLSGWHPFPKGPTSPEFQQKLAALCEIRLKQTRGIHVCEFCRKPDWADSSSELRVAGSGKIYAAPTMVHHYVTAHRYRPPDEFIAAVLAWKAADSGEA